MNEPRVPPKPSRTERAPTEKPSPDHFIAIIGMGCRYPAGANSPDEFWKILNAGIDGISEIPRERWDKEKYFDPDVNAPGKMYTTRGGFLNVPVELFDNHFFNISAKEALEMDPQQRLLLEVAWEALEDAGTPPLSLKGTQTGVFIGVSGVDYQQARRRFGQDKDANMYSLVGTTFSVLSGRLSYFFGFEGPSLVIDTACSSSLVAIENACSVLRNGRAEMALAGGVNMALIPDAQICLTKLQALSPDGKCKAFDASANGYARSEGCGLVVLKPLRAALRDGNRIHGVIRGAATNQDGKTAGLNAPSASAQRNVIGFALKDAGARPSDIGYIEAHGTGTPLGDKTELDGISQAMEGRAKDAGHLMIGSVKSNVGHLEAAAGVTGLMKVLLAFRHEQVPANLHFMTPNPSVDWENLLIDVVHEHTPWKRGSKPRLAGVSSFGFSGTNCHLIVEEPPAVGDAPVCARLSHVLPLSAKTPDALRAMAKRYADFLAESQEGAAGDICHAAATGRSDFEHRMAVSGETPEELARAIQRSLEDDTPPPAEDRRIVFLFTGQGSQYAGMARSLYSSHPRFASTLERCDRILRPLLDQSIIEIIYADPADEGLINHTRFAQPLIFAIEYALADLWQSWGIKPAAVLGHSIGEYAAACVAGVFSLEDALKLVAARGRLMGSAPGHGMMAAAIGNRETVESAVAPFSEHVSVGVLNTPSNFVISGFVSEVNKVIEQLAGRGVHCKPLMVSHAFHSPQMDPILDEFLKVAQEVTYNEPTIPLISNLSAREARTGEVTNARYWRNHIRGAVRFFESIAEAESLGYRTFLEIGATSTLTALGSECAANLGAAFLPSLQRGQDDWSSLSGTLCRLYERGLSIDWEAFDAPYKFRKVSVPLYPFQGKRFWIDLVKEDEDSVLSGTDSFGERNYHPVIGQRITTPGLDGVTIFQANHTRENTHIYREHLVLGQELAPAASYVNMAMTAARYVLPGAGIVVQNIDILQPLLLMERARTVQLIVRKASEDEFGFTVVSRDRDRIDDPWQLHCTGSIVKVDDSAMQPPQCTFDFEAWKAQCPKSISVKDFYDEMAALNFVYGPSFHNLTEIRYGDLKGLARVDYPEPEGEYRNYELIPGYLDSVFQTLAGPSILEDRTARTSNWSDVPIHLARLVKYDTPLIGSYWIYTETEKNNDSKTGTMWIVNDAGQIHMKVEGYTVRRVQKSEMLRDAYDEYVRRLMYEISWKKSDLAASAVPQPAAADAWIVLEQRGTISSAIGRIFDDSAEQVIRIVPSDDFQDISENLFSIDVLDKRHFERLFRLLAERGVHLKGIVHLLGVTEDSGDSIDADSLKNEIRKGLGSLLALTQGLVATQQDARLYVVTNGVFSVDESDASVSVSGGALPGMITVTALEQPELSCTHVDLSRDPSETERAALLRCLAAPDAENRIALRGDKRFVARLVPYREPQESRSQTMVDFAMKIRERGAIENIEWAGHLPPEPGDDDVNIQVLAAGLNFRDVLNVLGEYPGDPGQPGLECAGIVLKTGKHVTSFKPGDEVVAHTVTGAFASLLTVPAANLVAKPANISFEEAGAIPITFMTAWYALHDLGKIRAGEKILIHAGAGGVGLAAIQLAQAAGAEIFATAGSPAKRALLKRLGVPHVMDSRSTDFADEIMNATSGVGVDLVLNSLTGEALRKSLQVLAKNGRFLEMGKREILGKAEIDAINPSISYMPFDLIDAYAIAPSYPTAMLTKLLEKFARGELKPTVRKVFPVERIKPALRYMAQAKHTGKIAISMRDFVRKHGFYDVGVVQPDRTYLITGGLGALGLRTCEWLVESGATSVVLTGRRTPEAAAAQRIEAMKAGGADIRVMQADIARRDDVRRIIATIDASMPPLKGVIHAAGVLDDKMISDQTWERFEGVMNPKVDGSWFLHEETKNRFLDFFVMFSSVSSSLGNLSQSNYAAANAFMNGLAAYRRSLGLSGISICWGPWAEIGMAAETKMRGDRMSANGISGIQPDEGMVVLKNIIKRNVINPSVIDMNWTAFFESMPAANHAGLLSSIALAQKPKTRTADRPEKDTAVSAILEVLAAAPQDKRLPVLTEHLKRMACRVMGYDDLSLISVDQRLLDQGFDSLMAVEFRNRLAKQLDRKLPVTLLFDYPTIAEIAPFVLADLPQLSRASTAQREAGANPAPAEVTAAAAADRLEQVLAGASSGSGAK